MYYEIIKKLEDVITIKDKVSKELEVTKFLLKYPKNPIYFKNLDGYEAVGNIWAERKNISKALGNADILQSILYAINNPINYEIMENNPFKNYNDFSLKDLPIPKYFEKDGSNYITSGIVFSEKDGKKNASFHRMMVIDEKRAAVRLVPRDLYRMYNESITSIDYSIDESTIASSLRLKTLGEKEKMVKLSNNINVPFESEYVFEGKIIDEKYPAEGPFLDVTRTYDIKENQPIVIFERMYTNERPIFHILLSGGYEHYNLMGMPREPTIYQEIKKKGINILDVKLTYGGCSWLHAIVKIKKKNENLEDVEWSIATRFQGDRDMVIKKERGSSLDPSRYENDITTKIGIDATIKGEEKEKFKKEF